MGTLFTFGCSHTESYETTSISPLYKSYYEFRGGNFPDVWPTLLSKKLNFNVKNYGWASSTNEEITHRVFKHINEIKKGDILIIQWSYAHRFKWIDQKTNQWQKMGVNNRIDGIIHEQTYMDMINNITHPLYCELIYNYEPVIEHIAKTIGFDVYYWSTDYNIIHNLPEDKKRNRKYLIPIDKESNNPYGGSFDIVIQNGGEYIFNETNYQVNDCHLGEKGHKVQSELFYKHITNE
jgi:hypothetical protein